jgi:ribosomal protein L11 methyltransferase
MAFGTGLHPTTRTCLRALEDVLRPGDCVLVKGSRVLGLEAVAAALAAEQGTEA